MIWKRAVVVAVIVSCAVSARVAGDETDQFTLPDRESFADIGPFLTLAHYRALERVVDRANERIEDALKATSETDRAARIARYHDPGYLADQVRGEFGAGLLETKTLEFVTRDARIKQRFGERILAHHAPNWIYNSTHLPFDPRKIVLFFQSSTMNVYGVYLGTDKLGHFHDLGHIYFKDYLAERRRGASEEKALDAIVKRFSVGIISEGFLIGNIATGVYANADLAANYLGMKFYRNLTEPVMLKGREQPPMLVLHGPYWRMNYHVRPDSDFFEPFVSDHLNEALNPNMYEWGMRGPISKRLEKDADRILDFYADEYGVPRSQEYFVRKAAEMVTYYGENYGHTGIKPEMVTIANSCFPEASVGAMSPQEPDDMEHSGNDSSPEPNDLNSREDGDE